MGFWDLSDGESAVTNETTYESPDNNFDPIPDGTNALAFIEEAKWDEDRDENRYLKIKWRVEKPEDYLNRVIFQKLWILDDDPNVKDADKMKKKRDRAKQMLATIDANAGGKLGRKAGIPSNDDFALALSTRQMVIKCMVWTIKNSDGTENTGNWISAIMPKTHEVKAGTPRPAPKQSVADDLDSEIPF